MYRLLIVDDEPIIADGLYEEFQNLVHLELDVYRAYSGKAALEILGKSKIDILLTDIKMPGIDGMELLKRTQASWPDCKVIFLTGYKEFDYAYNAIQYKGVSYILKTEGYAKVIGVVEKVITEIEESLKSIDITNKANELVSRAATLLQKEYLIALIQGEDVSLTLSYEEFSRLGIQLKPDVEVLMLMGRIDELPIDLNYSDRAKCFYTIKLIVEQYLEPLVQVIHFIDNYNNHIWIIQPRLIKNPNESNYSSVHGTETENWNNIILFVEGTLETIQSACKQTLGMTISFSLNTQISSWKDIPQNYDSLRLLMDYRIGSGVEMLLTDKSAEIHETIQKSRDREQIGLLSKAKLEALEMYLERGMRKEFIKLLNEITSCLSTIAGKHYAPALQLYYSLALLFSTYINRWKMEQKLSNKIELNKLLRIDKHGSWGDTVNYLYQISESIFDIRQGEVDKRAIDTITSIKEYINMHISEEISLVKLAEMVYFNPSYLSRLFKHLTGINLSEFIQEVRIKKAKQLLKRNDLKVSEIAKAVGYNSATNFSRFFKSVTNKTPQEFREALSESNIENQM